MKTGKAIITTIGTAALPPAAGSTAGEATAVPTKATPLPIAIAVFIRPILVQTTSIITKIAAQMNTSTLLMNAIR